MPENCETCTGTSMGNNEQTLVNKPSQHAETILVVEDDPGDFGLIRALIRLAHHVQSDDEEPVIWAQTLADGVAKAGVQQPDVVLLDLSLPDSSGVATVRAMRTALPDVPIVVLTGHDDSWLAIAALEAGAQDYLVKGQFEVDALKRAVRNARVRGALESRLRLLNQTLEQRVQEEVAKNREKDLVLIQQSRLATMGEVLHNIAHQWRQPLNALAVLQVNIKDAFEYNELTRESMSQYTEEGQRYIQKMSKTIDDFRNFFQSTEKSTRFNLVESVRQALSIMDASFEVNKIAIAVETPVDVFVEGMFNELSHALLNVLINARDAIKAKGRSDGVILIWLAHEDDMGVIRIRDNGGGIPEKIISKVFDPYFTTRENGTGIGLYMARMTLEHMHGRIEAHNVEGGAEIAVFVPATS